jgi:hypothetical protein
MADDEAAPLPPHMTVNPEQTNTYTARPIWKDVSGR